MNKQISSALAQGDHTPVVLQGKDSEVRITSVELVEMINTFRKEEGNKTEKRHSDLMTSIATEIRALDEAGINQRNFSLVDYTDKKGETRPCYSMNKAGALQMLNKESAVVRYKTVQYIEMLEQALKHQHHIQGYDEEIQELGKIVGLIHLSRVDKIRATLAILQKYDMPTLGLEGLIGPSKAGLVNLDEFKEEVGRFVMSYSPVGQSISDYYQTYVAYCEGSGIKRLEKYAFSKLIKEFGYNNKSMRNGKQIYRGWYKEVE